MLTLDFNHLLDYTDWERQKWRDPLRQQGDPVLKISVGSHGDGRFATVGDLVRHIFSAETRYVERLSGRPLSDTSVVPNDSMDALFEFGQCSRKSLKELIVSFPAEAWDRPREFTLMNFSLTVTPRKIILQVVLHETRHWAQLATLLRLNGIPGDFHGFLFSPVLGGELKQEQVK